MTRIEQIGVAMGLLIDNDGMHVRRRVHGLISLCSVRRKDESLLDEAAQRGARAA
jgi:hypothetical protein